MCVCVCVCVCDSKITNSTIKCTEIPKIQYIMGMFLLCIGQNGGKYICVHEEFVDGIEENQSSLFSHVQHPLLLPRLE